MSIISIAEARAHLRVEDDYPAEQITPYLEAAENDAQRFLNRRVYKDLAELNAALVGVPVGLVAAAATRAAAIEAAQLIEDRATRAWSIELAQKAYCDQLAEARMVGQGIVVNGSIKAAMLLILGHLSLNREEVITGTIATELPRGVEKLLFPYRVGLGI